LEIIHIFRFPCDFPSAPWPDPAGRRLAGVVVREVAALDGAILAHGGEEDG